MQNGESKSYEALYDAAKAINSSLDVDDVLAAIVKAAATGVGAKACSLLLLSPDKEQLLHTAAYGLSDSYVKKGPVAVDASMADALDGQTVEVYDIQDDPRVQYPEEARKEGIASILCMPVTLGDDVIGTIRIYTSDHRHFSASDVHFLEAVANLGAVALEKARLHQSVKKDYDELNQELLKWRASMGVWPLRLGGRR